MRAQRGLRRGLSAATAFRGQRLCGRGVAAPRRRVVVVRRRGDLHLHHHHSQRARADGSERTPPSSRIFISLLLFLRARMGAAGLIYTGVRQVRTRSTEYVKANAERVRKRERETEASGANHCNERAEEREETIEKNWTKLRGGGWGGVAERAARRRTSAPPALLLASSSGRGAGRGAKLDRIKTP